MIALAIPAFLAGLLMFLAPCTLPIVPGYLAFISAVPEESAAAAPALGGRRRRVLQNAFAFVVGFSVLFIVLGVFAGFIGQLLGPWRYAIARGAGLVLILFGIVMLGRFTLPVLSSDWRLRLPRSLTLGRWESSFLIGVLFALGWSPCIGPILGGILFLASSSATAGGGAVLLAIFSLGLGIPFLICALLLERTSRFVLRFARISSALQILGAIVLIIVGALILFNLMGVFVTWVYALFGFLGYDKLLNYL